MVEPIPSSVDGHPVVLAASEAEEGEGKNDLWGWQGFLRRLRNRRQSVNKSAPGASSASESIRG